MHLFQIIVTLACIICMVVIYISPSLNLQGVLNKPRFAKTGGKADLQGSPLTLQHIFDVTGACKATQDPMMEACTALVFDDLSTV